MSRPITAPEVREARRQIIRRVVATAKVMHGQATAAWVAHDLGLPVATWTNTRRYGGTIPGQAILRLIVSSNVEPLWLLRGTEPMFRGDAAEDSFDGVVERLGAVVQQRLAERAVSPDR